ncbi:MAG: LCP family protein [Eubacterium sp.]|nr:LCP family protein [Eubacterium sp.]
MNNLNGPDSIKKGDYGYSSESLSGGSSRKAKQSSKGAPKEPRGSKRVTKTDAKKLKNSTIISIILVVIQLALSGYFVYLMMTHKWTYMPNVPDAIFIGICAGLVFFLIIAFILANAKKRSSKRFGKFISIIVIIALIVCIFVLPFLSIGGKSKVDENPFVVFVSAADTFGDLNKEGNERSDTNILAAVNPKTHTVMMVSIPRDYYIPVIAKSVSINTSLNSDKLTHIGLYGNGQARNNNGEKVGAAGWNYACEVHWDHGKTAIMDSLKKQFKFNVDSNHYHYAQLNFTGFGKLIDELGGIDVDVEKSFSYTTYEDYGEDNGKRKKYTFKKGRMEMDGNEALTFARTRKAFADGDIQRNRNQTAVLKGVADKALSPTILLRYNGVMSAINDCLETDIDASSMALLQSRVAGHQGYDGWKIVSFGVIGESSRQRVLWNGQALSVVLKNDTSVDYGQKLLNKTLAGTDSKTLKRLAKKYTNAQGQ